MLVGMAPRALNIRTAVLATLAWHDALGVPLTPVAAWQHLVNPARLLPKRGTFDASLRDVVRQLEHLAAGPHVVTAHGYYALASSGAQLIEAHLEREKIIAQKFRRLLAAARWLQAVPYVRALASSGSLALGTADEDGDFDLFVVARAGRLYTCRLFLLAVATFLRRRRYPGDRRAPDRFCFNHYVTDAALTVPYESIFTANVFTRLIPVYDRGGAFAAFWEANSWLHQFTRNFDADRRTVRRSVRRNRMLTLLARAGERVLDTRLGDQLERWAQRYQQRRITANPLTREPGGRIVATDGQLEFHPRSVEPAVLARYTARLDDLGIHAPAERDSGLVQRA